MVAVERCAALLAAALDRTGVAAATPLAAQRWAAALKRVGMGAGVEREVRSLGQPGPPC